MLGAQQLAGIDAVLEHSWSWPLWLTVLVVVLSAALVIHLYRSSTRGSGPQRAVMATLRLSALLLLVFMMYGWVVHRHRVDLPDLIVALDDSQSMAVEDEYSRSDLRRAAARLTERASLAGPTRWNQALALFLAEGEGWGEELESRYRTKLYRIGGSARVMPAGEPSWFEQLKGQLPTEDTSRIGDSLRRILDAQRGRPTAAVVLLTDGISTSGSSLADVAEIARRNAVPLYVVGLGDDESPRDVRLTNLLADDSVFVGDMLTFDGTLQHDGFPGHVVIAQLLDASRQVLDEQRVTLTDFGGSYPVRLSFRPQQTGKQEYRLELKPLAGETSIRNNGLSHSVVVRDEQIRVLLVQAYPNYEFRTLKHLLSRMTRPGTGDKVVDLSTVLQSADFDFADQDATALRVVPVNREALFRYDVILLGDVDPAQLSNTTMRGFEEFVTQRGGGLVLLAGPRFNPAAYRGSPLEPLYPFDLRAVAVPDSGTPLDQPYSVSLTALGRSAPYLQLGSTPADSEALWRDLPPLYWSVAAQEMKPAARVLLAQQTAVPRARGALPVVTMQFVGAGKVVFHATDESYRWAQHEGSDQYYSRYWLQMLRYLSRSKLLSDAAPVELLSDRQRYQYGEAVRVKARIRDDSLRSRSEAVVRLLIESDQGRRRELDLRRDAADEDWFVGFLSDLQPARYRVSLVVPQFDEQPPAAQFDVLPPDGELTRLEMQIDTLRQAASLSRGRFYRIDEAARLLRDLPRGRRVQIETLPPIPLWNSNWLAAAVVALLTAEWLLRRRAGMI